MFPAVNAPIESASYSNKVRATRQGNLLAYWSLWEASGTVANDISGNGRNGTTSGATPGQTGIGDGRTSYLFDGLNDSVNVMGASLAGAFNGAEGTLAAWVKMSAAGVWADGAPRYVAFLGADYTNNFVHIRKEAAANQIATYYMAGGTQKAVGFVTSSLNWLAIGVTWSLSANALKFYINGAQAGATQTGLGTWAGALIDAGLGALVGLSANYHSGVLAHAALWSTPLTPSEIAALARVS